MADLQTWGSLPKAQDDPQTILQAVQEYLDNHNTDSEAHMDTGGSLENHRQNDIIDHPARSIFNDKFAYNTFKYSTVFETIDAWHKSAGVAINTIGELQADTGTVANTWRYLYFDPGDSQQDPVPIDRELFWHLNVAFDNLDHYEAFLGSIDFDNPSGAGFSVTGGHLYAAWYTSGDVYHSFDLGALSPDEFYDLRFYIDSDLALHWQVDGVDVHTEASTGLQKSVHVFSFGFRTTNTTNKITYLMQLDVEMDSLVT